MKYLVVVREDMTVTLHLVKTPITKLGSHLQVPAVAESKRTVMRFLEDVENGNCNLNSGSQGLDEEICEMIRLLLAKLSGTSTVDKVHIIQFLTEQWKLFSEKKEQRRYSADFRVFCCLFFTISPHAYKYVRRHGSICLPHPMIIRRICSSYGTNPQQEHQSQTFLSSDMESRIHILDDRQRFVTLMVDDIHIKPYYDYRGGNMTGAALNSTETANSAVVFMVQSLTCTFKEVAHIAQSCTELCRELTRSFCTSC